MGRKPDERTNAQTHSKNGDGRTHGRTNGKLFSKVGCETNLNACVVAFLFLPLLSGGGGTGGTGYEVSYGAPSQSYGAPAYHEPSAGYDEPASGYEEPSSGYDSPSTGYDSRRYDSRSLNTEVRIRMMEWPSTATLDPPDGLGAASPPSSPRQPGGGRRVGGESPPDHSTIGPVDL